MTLTLSVLRCPDAVPPETKRINGGEFRIGRGLDNDWVMPDPDKMLSKKHCVVAFRNGGWAIADTSTNGTFINREQEALGPGQIRDLSDGDRIRFGAYEIEVRIDDGFNTAAARGGAYGAPARSPFDDPFNDDVFAPKQAPPETFTSSAFGNDPLFGGPPPSQSVTMPARYDPLAPPTDDDFFAAPTLPDHSPSYSDAFRPPPVAPKLIPDDDWDLGLPTAKPATPRTRRRPRLLRRRLCRRRRLTRRRRQRPRKHGKPRRSPRPMCHRRRLRPTRLRRRRRSTRPPHRLRPTPRRRSHMRRRRRFTRRRPHRPPTRPHHRRRCRPPRRFSKTMTWPRQCLSANPRRSPRRSRPCRRWPRLSRRRRNTSRHRWPRPSRPSPWPQPAT
jgi:type VI secretion system protein ImpI/type VI secretion system protein